MTKTAAAATASTQRASPWSTTLRHPLVVGAAIAVLSGLFASFLIPSATRVWQDRPKELALKSKLVDRISKSATASLASGEYFDQPNGDQELSYRRLARQWRISSAEILSELTTYFGRTSLPAQWRNYENSVGMFLRMRIGSPESSRLRTDMAHRLRDHFRNVRFEMPIEQARATFVRGGPRSLAFDLLLEERDQIEQKVVATNASGFSHGYWVFGVVARNHLSI
jgi:hypothetical protein